MRFIIITSALLSSTSGNIPLAERAQGVSWLTINKCSVNALYLYLRLHSVSVSYAVIEKNLTVSSDGCPISELSGLANRLGLESSVVKLTPKSLANYGFPIIAHIENDGIDSGHYIVVLGVRDSVVDLIDGTSGSKLPMSRVEFYKQWTGFAMVRTPSRGLVSMCVLILGLIVLVCEGGRTLAKARHALRPFPKSVVLIIAALMIWAWQAGHASGQDLARLADDIDVQWAGVTQFKVKYSSIMKALVDNERIHEVLGVDYLLKTDRTYAFDGDKRYFEQSDSATPLSPTPGAASFGELRKSNIYTYNGKSDVIRYMDKMSKMFATTSLDNPAYASDRKIFDQEFLGFLYRSAPNIFASRRPGAVHVLSLSDKLRSGVFRFTGYEELDGVSCVKVQDERGQAIESVWLSPALRFAVVKRETRKRGVDGPASVTVLHDHRLVSKELYVPHLITTLQYYEIDNSSEYPRKPLLQHVVTVKECKTTGLPEAMFRYEPPSGTPALGDLNGRRVPYVVPADQRQLDSVLADMQAGYEEGTLHKLLRLFIVPAVVLGTCLAAVTLVYFRFRRRSTI